MTEHRQPILIVLHQELSTPGRVGHALTRRGIALDIRRPRFGDPLPPTMSGHAGVVVFGGPMSVNDDADYIRDEIDWLSVPLREGKPLLGICLGAQMLVKQLGGVVAEHPEGRAEIGYYPIRPTEAGRAFIPAWPEQVYQWHREGFDLPRGATLMAEGDSFPVQAFRVGANAFGLQFHPDVTYAMMHRWTTKGHDRLSLPGAKPRAAHFADRAVYDGVAQAWFSAFMDQWVAPSPAPASSPGLTDQPEPVVSRAAVSAASAETRGGG